MTTSCLLLYLVTAKTLDWQNAQVLVKKLRAMEHDSINTKEFQHTLGDLCSTESADDAPSSHLKRKRSDSEVGVGFSPFFSDTRSGALVNWKGGNDDLDGEPVPTDEECRLYARKIHQKMLAPSMGEIQQLKEKLYFAENELENVKKTK